MRLDWRLNALEVEDEMVFRYTSTNAILQRSRKGVSCVPKRYSTGRDGKDEREHEHEHEHEGEGEGESAAESDSEPDDDPDHESKVSIK